MKYLNFLETMSSNLQQISTLISTFLRKFLIILALLTVTISISTSTSTLSLILFVILALSSLFSMKQHDFLDFNGRFKKLSTIVDIVNNLCKKHFDHDLVELVHRFLVQSNKIIGMIAIFIFMVTLADTYLFHTFGIYYNVLVVFITALAYEFVYNRFNITYDFTEISAKVEDINMISWEIEMLLNNTSRYISLKKFIVAIPKFFNDSKNPFVVAIKSQFPKLVKLVASSISDYKKCIPDMIVEACSLFDKLKQTYDKNISRKQKCIDVLKDIYDAVKNSKWINTLFIDGTAVKNILNVIDNVLQTVSSIKDTCELMRTIVNLECSKSTKSKLICLTLSSNAVDIACIGTKSLAQTGSGALKTYITAHFGVLATPVNLIVDKIISSPVDKYIDETSSNIKNKISQKIADIIKKDAKFSNEEFINFTNATNSVISTFVSPFVSLPSLPVNEQTNSVVHQNRSLSKIPLLKNLLSFMTKK